MLVEVSIEVVSWCRKFFWVLFVVSMMCLSMLDSRLDCVLWFEVDFIFLWLKIVSMGMNLFDVEFMFMVSSVFILV